MSVYGGAHAERSVHEIPGQYRTGRTVRNDFAVDEHDDAIGVARGQVGLVEKDDGGAEAGLVGAGSARDPALRVAQARE